MPVSANMVPSSQKPAFQPPPRSSVPRTTRRDVVLLPLDSEVIEPAEFLTERTDASMKPPNETCDDC